MRWEKEVASGLLREAIALGVQNARISWREGRQRHPRLLGSFAGKPLMVVFAGSSKDRNAVSLARQNLRRAVWKAEGRMS